MKLQEKVQAMPRILHVIAGLEIGGAEMALYRLIHGSKGGPYTHTVISLSGGGSMGQRFVTDGIEVINLDFKRSPVRQFFHLKSLIREAQPDIVQTWMYHADMVGGLAARMAGVPHVIWGIRTTRLSTSSCSRATSLVRQVCAWLSNWIPDKIVCVAEASMRAHARIGYDARRMVVVGNGFDVAEFAPALLQRQSIRSEFDFSADHVVVGSVSRFDLDKDHRNFVLAAGTVARQHPHVRFLMIGPGLVHENSELAGWIAATGYSDRFVLLGERHDIPACFSAMDIFCLSSRNEGFPNVVGEAMAMGLPCVATDVGDVISLMADTGVVVPKEDSVALAGALANLLDLAPQGRLDIGRKGKERVDAEFTLKRTREKFELIYQGLMEKGSI